MMPPHPFPHERITFIHEVLKRPLTLEECDECLEWRRMYGDLRPELVELEINNFIKTLKGD